MTPQIKKKLLGEISTTTDGIKKICKRIGISHEAVFSCIFRDDKFADLYARARATQADLIFDELVEISDDNDRDTLDGAKGGTIPNMAAVKRSELRVNTRKWILARLAPKKYGERSEVGIYPSDGPAKSPAEIAWENIKRKKGIGKNIGKKRETVRAGGN